MAYLGLSFGGHWAVKLAVRGVVDAAVNIGGPTGADEPETPEDRRRPTVHGAAFQKV
ncbi:MULTISPECIES: hypothetical protein [Streptomyces]|uniref:hypothetical protein n=1 Tax=Streptomyces TaxID=1883 RepID=UPI000304021D|nr:MULTISPECIES: hypothetical protein [Streptomyces]